MKKGTLSAVVVGLFCILTGEPIWAAEDNVNAPWGDAGIYGAVLNVKPNVLIVLDTSGSMNDDLPLAYDPLTTYPDDWHHYGKDQVYRYSWFWGWESYASSTSVITCNGSAPYNARSALETRGTWTGRINSSSPYDCGTWYSSKTLATGNFLNFQNCTTCSRKSKIDMAKDAIYSIMDSQVDASGNETVRMGLMRLDGGSRYCGGYIVKPCGTPYGPGSDFRNAVADILAGGSTPMGETLAEAGLYWAGRPSWAYKNRGIPSDGDKGFSADSTQDISTYTSYSSTGEKVYKSPIRWRCQKNFMIVVSDGMPNYDDGAWWGSGGTNIFTGMSPYIPVNGTGGKRLNRCRTSGTTPNDYDCDSAEASDSAHWMDDVTSFLYNEDLRYTTAVDASEINTFNDTLNPTQNVVTYTIGFGGETDTEYLARVASNGGSGSDGSFVALDQSALESSLSEIMAMISTRSTTFLAPVVPLNTATGSYADNAIYLGSFKTMATGDWRGNVKKYGFQQKEEMNGAGEWIKFVELYQKDGTTSALDPSDTSLISPNAYSVWTVTETPDGDQLDKGGAGAWMLTDAMQTTPTRVFYTHNLNVSAGHDPDSSLSLFSSSNANLTGTTGAANLHVEDAADCMDYIRAAGIYKPGTATTGRTWLMGDVLHSRPSLLRYGNYNLLFVGANDGFLHCIEDNQNDTNAALTDLNNDSVSVKWSFVPWELVGTLHEIRDDANREYFVDGIPLLYSPISSYDVAGIPTYSGDKLICFGLRRGGSNYYALKIGTANTATGEYGGGYASPSWKWWIKGSGTGARTVGTEALGQSWSTPFLAKLKTGTSSLAQGMLLAGGYDEVTQDALDPANPPASLPAGDTKGRMVYAVNPIDGSTLSTPTQPFVSSSFSIVDFLAFDRSYNSSNKIIDTIYAPDLGGKLYATHDSDENGLWTSSWSTSSNPLFVSGDGTSMVLKFFAAPDVALESTYDYLFIGTGDREHPNARVVASGGTQTVDRFYAIKNRWGSNAHSPLTESDLTDVTLYNYSGFNAQNVKGWFIQMNERTGEKVLNRPVVFNKVVYFTTYVPPDPSATAAVDSCVVDNLGDWRLYEVNYLSGKAVSDLNGDGVIDRNDRSSVQGKGLPPQISIAVTDKGPMLLIPTENAVKSISLSSDRDVVRYYWRQK